MIGYLFRITTWPERVLLAVAGLLLTVPRIYTLAAGVLMLLTVAVFQLNFFQRQEKQGAGS